MRTRPEQVLSRIRACWRHILIENSIFDLTSPGVLGTNTPLKVYEQSASGIPLVATRIHSHTQILDDEVCFLATPTAEGLAAGILEAITDSAEGDAVSRRASHHSTEASSSTRRGPALAIGNNTCAE